MKTLIGVKTRSAAHIVQNLNDLLVNFQIHYQNLRGLHWNIKGKNFFELHKKFEEYYTDAQLKVDLIAERILTLDGAPLHTFEDYLSISTIAVGKDISNDVKAVKLVLKGYQKLIEIERELLLVSSEADDEGTNTMIGNFVKEQEKIVWMLNAWLG